MLQDITDEGTGGILACLCDSDLCNNKVIDDTAANNNDDKESIESTTTTIQSITTLPILEEIVKKSDLDNAVGVQEVPRSLGAGFRVELDDNSLFFDKDKNGNIDKDLQQLRCYSCGSLLSADKTCTRFNSSDPSQIQNCNSDEACLMYSWNKSQTQKGTFLNVQNFVFDMSISVFGCHISVQSCFSNCARMLQERCSPWNNYQPTQTD